MECCSKFAYRAKPMGKTMAFSEIAEEEPEVDTNVIKIDLSALNEKKNICQENLLLCTKCNAVFNNSSQVFNKEDYIKRVKQNPLNQVDDAERAIIAEEERKSNEQAGVFINDLNENEYVWICEFCHNHNKLTENPKVPNVDDLFYIIEKNKEIEITAKADDKIQEEGDDVKLLFCVDVSGSMSAFHPGKNGKNITRMNAIKDSIRQQIEEMKKTNPKRKVGLILFGSTATLKGDCCGPEIVMKTNYLNDFEKLFDDSKDSSALLLKRDLLESNKKLLEAVDDIETGGSTALGPALVCGLGLATGKPGSKIILCTDGLANQGLGNVEDASKQDESIKFYERVGDIAVEQGISISVVTIKGNACKVEMLGPLTDRTAGVITRVDPVNMDLTELTKEEIIATKVEMKVLLHAGLAFRNESASDLKNDGSLLSRHIGNVTKRNSATVEYRFKNSNEIKQQKLDMAELKTLPLQAQITFTDNQGNKWVRIITKSLEITTDKEAVEKEANVEILAKHAQKQAAHIALKGDVKEAQKKNKAWQKFVAENKNIGANKATEEERSKAINAWSGDMDELDDLMEEVAKPQQNQIKKDDVNTKLWGMKQKK